MTSLRQCDVTRVNVVETFERAYETVLGGDGNTVSWIAKHEGDSDVERHSTPNVLSCNELRYFWVGTRSLFLK